MTKSETTRAFFEAYSSHNVDKMVDLCTNNATYYYVPYGEEGKGNVRNDAKELWQTFTTVMPDFYVDIQNILETEDDIVVAETLQGGTLEHDVMGIKGNGKKNEAPHIYLITFEGDKISHVKCYWDNNTIYTQLGHTEEHN